VKSKFRQQLRLLTLSWVLGGSMFWHMSLSAVIAAPIKFKLPPAPPLRGIAGHRSSASSRSNCPAVSQDLTAIVPKYDSAQGNIVWGLTGMAHPTIWFYVPYDKSAIVDISFTLQDESNPADTKIIYQNLKLVPNPTAGMMGVALPKSSAPLISNQPYRWFLKLNMPCTVGQRPISVDGWVQRRDLEGDLSAQIKQASPREKVSLYAANGLWFDAIGTLASLRSSRPQDPALAQDWQSLLGSIDLAPLASQSFVGEPSRSSQGQQSRERGF
jgi:Domain of Unknown Function (DUF928)